LCFQYFYFGQAVALHETAPGKKTNRKAKTRRKTMRKLTMNLFLACSATVVIGAAFAAESYQLNASVPFGFEVNGRTMPAGSYDVRQTQAGVPSLRNNSNGRTVFTQCTGEKEGKGQARLIFHRYGDHYFLAEIWSPGKLGTVMKPSRTEKELMNAGVAEEAAVIPLNLTRKAD
jgi:hypothetical protein